MDQSAPPFEDTYRGLLHAPPHENQSHPPSDSGDCELPIIDLSRLSAGEAARADCIRALSDASKEWGFFQAVNHGVPRRALQTLLDELRPVFRRPFPDKVSGNVLRLEGTDALYRWGNPAATSRRQVSWSEAFHVPVKDISSAMAGYGDLRWSAQVFAEKVGGMARLLAEVLAAGVGPAAPPPFFRESFSESSCYLRLIRYPALGLEARDVLGLVAHTDTDLMTVVAQEQGGLEVEKQGRWLGVRPNPGALVVNIGDLFQAWSNGVYRSVRHRVLTSPAAERFSAAYFYCPDNGARIQGDGAPEAPPLYRAFTYGEYKEQVRRDVQETGDKVGLPRFLL